MVLHARSVFSVPFRRSLDVLKCRSTSQLAFGNVTLISERACEALQEINFTIASHERIVDQRARLFAKQPIRCPLSVTIRCSIRAIKDDFCGSSRAQLIRDNIPIVAHFFYLSSQFWQGNVKRSITEHLAMLSSTSARCHLRLRRDGIT